MTKTSCIILSMAMLVLGCDQEIIRLEMPDDSSGTGIACEGVSAGNADLTRFIAVGNSFVAGFQAGALFDEGQQNSLAIILNKQFECAGASTTFNQPAINTEFGYNIFITPNPTPQGAVLGRLLLQGASPRPTPQLSDNNALPNPAVNPGFIYTGSKATLNNFGVQAIVVGQALIPQTGAWAGAGTDPRFNPFYGRLSYPGTGTSTLIGDAASAGGTFFLLWLGMDDFLLHAAFGGDPSKAPLTNASDFQFQYGAAVVSMLNSNPQLKGVIANYPSIFVMPHFTSVPWNALPLDPTTAAALTSSLANNYNAFIDGMISNSVISSAEGAARKITFTTGQNGVLAADETLTDLSPYMTGPYAALLPYARARQTRTGDILPLSAASVIGTAVGGDATKIYGATIPLSDQYVLIPGEIAAIESARNAFNATVKAVADANPERLAFADVNQLMAELVTNRIAVYNNVTITPNINPPTGIYSEDGIHPNSRGYAFISRGITDAINKKFGSTLTPADLSKYQGTALPIP